MLLFVGCGRGSGSDGIPSDRPLLKAIGLPCDLTVDAGATQSVYNASATECPSRLCLKPVVQMGAAGSIDTTATCSAGCNQDSDCLGELGDRSDPLDTRCESGFVCAIPMVVGPLACQKLCVCKDFFGPSGARTPIACQGGPVPGAPTSAASGVGQQTDVYVSVAPQRLLDLVFMIDNSPSMGPKVAKLNAQFPKLLEALKDPFDGFLPDLRVGIINSDLGTGGVNPGCATRTLADGTVSSFGDLGRFQMLRSPSDCAVTSGSTFLEYKAGKPMNYAGEISQVFACLAGNLGVGGCGFEHQLQAFEFALAVRGVGTEEQQAAFLRHNAYLGLVFVTDEDDCSAALNDGVFEDNPELRGEAPSLRCATRGHRCGGLNLTDAGPGYPTRASFVHPFTGCEARNDTCPNLVDGDDEGTDTSVPTACAPFKNTQRLAEEIKGLRADPENQVFVAGIFGWPPSDAAMATAQYKIAPVPNPNTSDTEHPIVYDYWPVCYDPDHLPSPTTTDPVTGFDATAAGWGATGGLRESAFVDEFGENGLKLSICERDFSGSMQRIGNALAKKLQNLCVDFKLLDTDVAMPGLQPECRVVWRTPGPDPKNPAGIIYTESPASLPPCPAGATKGNVATDCWQLLYDTARCPVNGQLVVVLRTAEELAAKPQLDPGTKLGMQCLTCPPGTVTLDPASFTYQACNY